MFERELAFFIENQKSLVRDFAGRVLLLREEEVVGTFATPLEAYLAGKERFGVGHFMVQPCVEGPSAYTVTIATAGVLA